MNLISCSLLVLALMAAEAPPEPPDSTTVLVPDPTPLQQFDHTYEASPEEVLAALDRVLARASLAVESHDEGRRETGWKQFSREDFGRNVALEAPQMSALYPFFQPKQLATGYYRLLARIEPVEGETRLVLVADLTTQGFNRSIYEHQWLQRRSNGTIEDYFHRHLEGQLQHPDASR